MVTINGISPKIYNLHGLPNIYIWGLQKWPIIYGIRSAIHRKPITQILASPFGTAVIMHIKNFSELVERMI